MSACLADTAVRLIATPDTARELPEQWTPAQMRKLGRALAAAEPLGLRRAADDDRVTGTQGVCLTLGFRNDGVRGFVEKFGTVAAQELSETLGGYESALQLDCRLLKEDNWDVADYRVPGEMPHARLHEYLDHHSENTAVEPKYAQHHSIRTSAEWRILSRRIRYRLGIDHAEPTKTSPKVHWWTTPTTYGWMAQWTTPSIGELPVAGSTVPMRYRFVDYLVCHAMDVAIGLHAYRGADWANRSSDDWGAVDLVNNPLKVLLVGPNSPKTVVHHDVDKIFARAASQLILTNQHIYSSRLISNYVEHLKSIATIQRKLKPSGRVDVVLVYRGGGLDQSELENVDARTKFFVQCQELVKIGIEVVIAMDHGQATILPNARAGLGIHEAITPTAGAAWILREHINMRLVDALPDLGQHAG